MSQIPLILFAKTPVAGTVKTRLTPELSHAQAAEVAKVLLSETLALSTQHWPGEIILALWPDAEHQFVQDQLNKFGVPHLIQASGDLGVKMLTAMDTVGYPCAVMGCDVPHLSAAELQKAHQVLAQGKPVLGPTHDGGYYLLGLQESRPELFSGQRWGGESVLAESQRKAQAESLEFTYLEAVSDIDTYADLCAASDELSSLRQFLV